MEYISQLFPVAHAIASEAASAGLLEL